MKLPLYQVDAFADRIFAGNPAAVCPLEDWLPEELMQSIAAENNLSETAFFVPDGADYGIRWFTPVAEVDLCGHATLASAHVIFTQLGHADSTIRFKSKSGPLRVGKDDRWLVLDFPAQPPVACETPAGLLAAFDKKPIKCLKSCDYIVVFNDEVEIVDLRPDFETLSRLDLRGVAVTAPSQDYDFVSRFFAPRYGVDEDPVTGSSYTQLAPYWAQVLGRSKLRAKQVSRRGGEVRCELAGDRVLIAGKAVSYLAGEIEVP